jgi:hypothetical protein
LEISKILPNFANKLTKNVDKTQTGTINNALNMRGLQELPPPYLQKLTYTTTAYSAPENIGMSKYKRI